jgi:serine/threonine protein kinase
MLDFTNYTDPVEIANTGMLNKGIIRWSKKSSRLSGPQYIVTKKVCWENELDDHTPFLLNRRTITKGNIHMEKEMLEWAQANDFGPQLYTSMPSQGNCIVFALQYFDCTLDKLNETLIERTKGNVTAILNTYKALMADAHRMAVKLDKEIAKGKIIMDIKGDNLAIDLTNRKVRILDWGAAQRPNKDCTGMIVDREVCLEFLRLPLLIPELQTNSKYVRMRKTVTHHVQYLNSLDEKNSQRIEACIQDKGTGSVGSCETSPVRFPR